MSQDFRSESLLNRIEQILPTRATSLGMLAERNTPHLTLVASKPATVQKVPDLSQSKASNMGFSAEVQTRGLDLYEMNIQDPFHELACELFLEIEKNEGEKAVVCHFSNILDESNKFLDEDETLYGTIMIQFQMKVLEQLFVFCADHQASQLSIYMDDDQAEGFGIVQDFLTHCDEAITQFGEKTEMRIFTDQNRFDQWHTFMEMTNRELERGLWRQQRVNPAIRSYLQSRAQI